MARLLLIALIMGVGLLLLSGLLKRRKSDSRNLAATLDDTHDIAEALRHRGKNGDFVVLLIPGTEQRDGCTANLQYSVENDRPGLDGVLIAERNIADQAGVETIFESFGLTATEHESNGVRYLRVEDSTQLGEVGRRILIDLYDVEPGQQLRLIVEGLEWPLNLPQIKTGST